MAAGTTFEDTKEECAMFVKSSLILVAAAALAAPAVAADPAVVRHVQFADLDLESAAGRATLERRLVRAAKSICAVNPALESRAVADEQARCEAETLASVQTQMDAAIRANRARVTRTAGY